MHASLHRAYRARRAWNADLGLFTGLRRADSALHSSRLAYVFQVNYLLSLDVLIWKIPRVTNSRSQSRGTSSSFKNRLWRSGYTRSSVNGGRRNVCLRLRTEVCRFEFCVISAGLGRLELDPGGRQEELLSFQVDSEDVRAVRAYAPVRGKC
jgi:hypothetical protein